MFSGGSALCLEVFCLSGCEGVVDEAARIHVGRQWTVHRHTGRERGEGIIHVSIQHGGRLGLYTDVLSVIHALDINAARS